MLSHATPDALKKRLAERLEEMRERTLALLDPLSDADYGALHEPTMGPVSWDAGHIPNFEEQWLVHGVLDRDAQRRHYDPTYDAIVQPRPARVDLDLPTREAALATMRAVRRRALEVLDGLDLEAPDRLVSGGLIHENILQHEAQHQENVLITIQLIPGRYAPSFREEKPRPRATPSGMVDVPGGPFVLGADLAPGVYDNESPAHVVDVASFRIGAAPVTNRDYLAFVEGGGYDDARWWSEDGWDLKSVLGFKHPKYWRKEGARWTTREYDRVLDLPLDQPVVHVSWHEADAYARWAGKRLPTEAEWEKAATWDPARGAKRRHPWGDAPWTPARANLDQRLFGPAPVGAYPDGVSAYGCHQMMGDVWEWTATELHGYPGFEAFPYDDYSTPFFGRGFMVLKGGSWATRPQAARGTFRNWHQQDHQQIFAGLRLAEDAPAEGAA